jgi:hypothetical protein
MEVLDKLNAPSFGMQDMELMALFARQAAIAIHQSGHLDALDATLIENPTNFSPPKTPWTLSASSTRPTPPSKRTS